MLFGCTRYVWYVIYAYGWKTVRRTCVLLLFWVLLFVLGLGWGGVGGHVDVPCTSYRIYCHVAKIFGIAYYVTCCYAAEISSVGWGWGGVGGHANVPCTSYMIYCHVAKISGIAYYVTCCYAAEISGVGWGWGWVGWGGMLTFLVLRTWYIAMLLRSLGSLTTWHVATLLRCHAIPALLAVALWVP